MIVRPPDPNRPTADPGTESQAEYIRRLEDRLQQISTLADAAQRIYRAESIREIWGELESAAVGNMGYSNAWLLVLEEGTLVEVGPPRPPRPGATSRPAPAADARAIAARAIEERRTVWVGAPPAPGTPSVPGTGPGGIAAVPLLHGDKEVGVLLVATQISPQAPAPEDLARVESLGRDAATAIAGLLASQRSIRCRIYLDALADVDREVLGATRLDEVLRFALRTAVERIGGAWGAVWVSDPPGERLRLSSTFGGGYPEFEIRLAEMGDRAQAALRAHGPSRGVDPDVGVTYVCAPMIAFDEPLGAIAVVGRSGGQVLGGDEEVFLRTLASQCALAAQNAHLGERERDALRRLEETQSMLMQTERLAALGEMSAKVAHEIRNPLSAIGGFARRIEKALAETDPNANYASIIVRETRRLETIVSEQLEFARAPRPRLGPTDLNVVVRETLQLIRDETERAGVQLQEAYETRVPEMLLDADRVKQVLLNILKNAVASTRSGQRIRVRTRASEGWAQVEIANDGERIAGDILEQLFVPFATGRNQGCGLGLAVADQIVKEHGGEIRVRSDEEWSVVFTVSLPIRQNQDRRRTNQRRRGRDRRWAA